MFPSRRLQVTLLLSLLLVTSVLAEDKPASKIDFSAIPAPIIFQGDKTTAYRDPAVIYHDGLFRAYFTVVKMEAEGAFWYLGYSRSKDLVNWTEPKLLTKRDRNLNFSSPGNIVRYNDQWMICFQSYPTPNNEVYGNPTARLWVMRSDDLEKWSEPEMLFVKGPEVPREEMGRMIDPYLIEDKDKPGRWLCFYKQNGVSMSWTDDFKTWHYFGRRESGENVCVLVEGDEYVMFHSPSNGIGVMRSKDLKTWTAEKQVIRLGQKQWPWSHARLTAGVVLDLRDEPSVGKYVMFFHGSSHKGIAMHAAHGHGTLALAWSDDLKTWHWPDKK